MNHQESSLPKRISVGWFKAYREDLQGLTPRQKFLYLTLCEWADIETGEVVTSSRELAEAVDCSPSTSQRILDALTGRNLILHEASKGGIRVKLKNDRITTGSPANEKITAQPIDMYALENEARITTGSPDPFPSIINKEERRDLRQKTSDETPTALVVVAKEPKGKLKVKKPSKWARQVTESDRRLAFMWADHARKMGAKREVDIEGYAEAIREAKVKEGLSDVMMDGMFIYLSKHTKCWAKGAMSPNGLYKVSEANGEYKITNLFNSFKGTPEHKSALIMERQLRGDVDKPADEFGLFRRAQ